MSGDDGRDGRLDELMRLVIALARNDFSQRASVGDGTDVLDGIATGLNMLAEEIERQQETERSFRRRIQHSERLAMVGQLAASVAHEVNNPATFVLGNLVELEHAFGHLESAVTRARSALDRGDVAAARDALSAADLDAVISDARVMLADGQTGIQRIARIVRDLRGFTRRTDERVERVSMHAVVADARKLVAREVSVRADLDVRLGPDGTVAADRVQLVQVLTNLLLNAAQAIPEATGRHETVTLRTRRDGASYVVEVSDTGTGIPEEARAHLFEPFFTTKGSERGTGLGLAVANEIVRKLGGALSFESEVGVGTTFTLRLPVAVDEGEASERPPPRAPSASSAGRARVLLIDDEVAVLSVFERMLRATCTVETCASGREALARLERDDRWDAIVCDLVMPEVDGVSVFEWVRANRPALAARMIVCSGGAFSPRGGAFLDAYEGTALEKPVARAALIAAIEQVAGLPRSA